MYDKVDIEVPFLPAFVNETGTDYISGFVDPQLYDFPLIQLSRRIDGEIVSQPIKSQSWDSITTGLAGIAVGFFPNGNGFNKYPHVRMKCSPAKLLQGHNVFGSENPRHGVVQMLANFEQEYPLINEHLDFDNAHVKYVDCTYSTRVLPFYRNRIYMVFESLASARQNVSRDDDYLLIGGGSDRIRAKLYYKLQELLADLKNSKKIGDRHRQSILSDQRLQDFALDLMRFEATIGPRKFEELAIPTRLTEFLKFNDWYLDTHKHALCRHLWSVVFKPLFSQIEGQTMKNVNDDEIKAKIDSAYIKTKIVNNSKYGPVKRITVSKRLANAVYNTYRAIKTEGYKKLQKEDCSTFKRNVNLLIDIGISRAFLKSLSPYSNDNVIPLINVINMDFSNQKPEWWTEPSAGFSDHNRFTKGHLRLVS